MRPALLVLFAAGTCAAAKDFPAWVRDAARQPTSAYPPKVAAEVLLSEERLTVSPDGKRIMTERGAVRVLQTSKDAPHALRTYNTKSGRIRDFRAWIVGPSGQESEIDRKRVIDIALDEHGSYEEQRAKLLECDANAPVGSVFAYEVIEEEDTIFTTYQYTFQGASPTAVSRFVLTLPDGWEVKGTTFNHTEVVPTVSGNTYTWELRALPWIEEQDFSPGLHALAPRLGVTYFPAGSASGALTPLRDWRAVSAWSAGFSEQATTLTPEISAKAAQLTAGATNDLDRIRMLAAFVQKTNYVAVDINLEHGGGYTPHAASAVLSRNYGDCKDKAALLRALLKAVGIDSYLIALYSGDREYVRKEWPSPMQFNHAIVAVKLPEGLESTAILENPKLGRMLIFDPTDPYTPVGDLPEEEQGSYALIVSAHDGDLMRLPQLPASANRIELNIEGGLTADGQAQAHVVSQYFGQSASAWRATAKEEGRQATKKELERIYARRLDSGITLDRITVSDQNARFDLSLDLKVEHLGQSMMGKMLVFKPGSLAPDHGYSFPKVERKQPIQLSARMRTDRVSLKLPEGYSIDELPDPLNVTGPYGTYRASWKASGDVVTMEQSLEIKPLTVPAADYAKVRDFFDRVTGGQFAPVVLMKK
jgi:transglutaminase-like putative cysteine protease